MMAAERGAGIARGGLVTRALTVAVASLALAGCGNGSSARQSATSSTVATGSVTTAVETSVALPTTVQTTTTLDSAVPTSAAPRATTTTTAKASGKSGAKPPSATTTTSAVPKVAPTTAPAPAPAGRGLRGATIVIDPGHNGANFRHTAEINRPVDAGGFQKACNTTGTAAGSYSEAEFTWALAQRLQAALVAEGALVILTRDNNAGWGPCIDARGQTAARNGAAALISIHADGAAPTDNGFHVIRPILIPGYTDATVAPATKLAEGIRDALVGQGFRTANYIGSNGISPRRDLGTLNRAGVPAVIVESGNMHNAGDLTAMQSDAGQQRYVAAFVAGLAKFLG
jgi:N-acetylmuramoyl-L-alanine amidase